MTPRARVSITTDFRARSAARVERRIAKRKPPSDPWVEFDKDLAPGCTFLGIGAALAEGFQVVHLPSHANQGHWRDWECALARGAIIVHVRASRNGREWYAGIPPEGFSRVQLEQLARQAGMLPTPGKRGDNPPVTWQWRRKW